MKKVVGILLIITLSLSGCFEYMDTGEEVLPARPQFSQNYVPVNYSRTEIDQTVKLMPPQEMENSGKIYVFNDLLFVGEERRGFHVFDNSDPRNPSKIKFIQLLGSTDLAIRNQTIYANQGADLIALQYDVSQDSLHLLKRIPNSFPAYTSPYGQVGTYANDSITLGWKIKD